MNELYQKLLASKKYKDVCPQTLERIWSECSLKYKREKDVEKAARERLHGITSAFMSDGEFKRALKLAEDGDLQALLSCHASTRERLPLSAMDAAFDRIFDFCGEPESVLDLACGMNPIYLKHRLPEARIVGVDISGQCVAVIRAFCDAEIHLRDLLCAGSIPQERFKLALLFKVLPLMERQQSGSAMQVLREINAEWIAVSFPTRTLGGRSVGMAENYARMMNALLPESRSIFAEFETENELFFILKEKDYA